MAILGRHVIGEVLQARHFAAEAADELEGVVVVAGDTRAVLGQAQGQADQALRGAKPAGGGRDTAALPLARCVKIDEVGEHGGALRLGVPAAAVVPKMVWRSSTDSSGLPQLMSRLADSGDGPSCALSVVIGKGQAGIEVQVLVDFVVALAPKE